MKIKVILAGSLLALTSIGNAQWSTGGCPVITSCDAGIGVSSPAYRLDIETATPEDGIRITQTSAGGAGLHLKNTYSGGHNWSLYSLNNANTPAGGHFLIYDNTSSAARFMIHGTSGNVGIGTIAPANKLDILTSGTDDGIRVTQNTLGGAWLFLNNTTTNGGNWGAVSTGGANNIGGGHFAIYDLNNGSSPKLFISGANGNVGIGTASAADKLSVNGNVAPDTDGSYLCGTSTNRWSAVYAINGTIQTSDKRFKKNINDMGYGINEIMQLRPVTYNWKENDNGTHLGFIAQELQEIIKEVVIEGNDKNKNLGVAYAELIPVLTKGIQEQQSTIEAQKKTNDSQSQMILDLQQQITELSQKVSGSTGISPVGTIETGFRMSQNEPNPFTHETVVKYTLPQTVTEASMLVYDLTGKQVSKFPIREKGAASLTITSENLAAGIYIYSIVADGKVVDSKRMIVAER